MRRLLIVRHAKASRDAAYATDFERPLNSRGESDALFMGEVLRKLNVKLQYLRSSSAVRAITTAQLIGSKLLYPPHSIIKDKNMYLADDTDLIRILHTIPDEIETAMIVGHNPGMHILAETLSDFQADHLPTCGIVCVGFAVDQWTKIHQNASRMLFYEYPGT